MALAEGGKLIVYAGGDKPGHQDFTKHAFEKRFPGMTLDIVVDLSKFHSGRIDYQLATNSLIPDVAQLQTSQDFPRWRKQGVFLDYKPIDWENVYSQFKYEGYYYAVTIRVLSNFVNAQLLLNPALWPREAHDYLKPEFKNKLVITHPTDDDGVLWWFRQIVNKYGWDYVWKLKAQNPTLVRGTQAASELVTAGKFPFTFTTSGSLTNVTDSCTRFFLPRNDPFVFWPQLGGIFKNAKHPAAAKLYMSWLLSPEVQARGYTFPVRRDVPNPIGYDLDLFSYTQTDIMGFARFMNDRQAVEIFKTQIGIIFGEFKGPTPTGFEQLGMYPKVALPH